MSSRIEVFTITSQVLADNPLGDPAVRRLPVYLPPGYDDTQRRYPVIWMLAGFTGRGQMLLNDNLWTPTIQQQLDALIAAGMPPVIMALPDCTTRYGGSQYINSAATGRYADHLIEELVPLVDAHLRTLPAARHRAVMGKSSGGYGALVHAMRRPDVFSAVACHSGDMYFEYCYQPDFPKFLNRIARNNNDPAAFFEEFLARKKKSGADFAALNVLAMAACYSPNPAAPGLPIDFPFDLRTGELRPEVWTRWLEHDPVRLVERYADNLRRLRLIFFDCGTRDEYHLHYGARILAERLRALGIAFEHEEFDDDHRGTWYRYDVSLPKLAAAISPEGAEQ
ncbi:alpha/beta hydrolase [Kallotenue papyrolyticum]|uniref:alpha/beta hydrolase n=1 Tax=Kallotenue papyrolyticum TaxID=1325125 RepID=UPI00047867B8|nr:alpha/beta hydrolase-fold protein [Kallotenue papyrolyticum]